MKAFIKKLSLLFAVGAMAFGSNLLNNEAKVAKAATTATATFGTNNIRIDSASVDFKDSQNNNWNVKTSGTTSFTASSEYYQVGSSNKPASKIVFSHTLTSDLSIDAFSIKMGGFTGTKGTVNLIAGSTNIGTGSLNAKSDVTISSSKKAECNKGDILKVEITSIAKGTKVYNFTWTYSAIETGATDEEKIAAVEDAIGAIGTVANTAASKKLIDDARSAYDALDAELKTSVSNYQDLLDAEVTYNSLVNQAAANAVITLLENLPEANEITDYSSASEVKAARNAYKTLTDEQKNLVPDQLVDKLEEVEAKLAQYAPAIETVTFNFMVNSYPDYLDNFEMSESEISFKMIQGSSPTSISTNTYINPARFYANYEVTLSSSDLVERISKVTITANDTSYAEVIKNANYSVSGKSISINGSVVTIEFNEDIKEFTFIPSSQTRVNKIEVEYNKYTVSQNTKVESITLDPSVLELTTGETATINAEILPGNAADRTVTWSSTDVTVASVEDGVVTALKEGTTTIKATANDGSGTAPPGSHSAAEETFADYHSRRTADRNY